MKRVHVLKKYDREVKIEATGGVKENYATVPQLLFSRRVLAKENLEEVFDMTVPDAERKGWCSIL